MIKHLNNFFSTAILVSLIIGLKDATRDQFTVPTTMYCVFFIFLRVKTYVDDYSYFKEAAKEAKNEGAHFITGFFLAIFSWCFWALSGYTVVKDRGLSFLFLGITLVISTLWIIAERLKHGAKKNQYYWMATNLVYCILLWSIEYFGRKDYACTVVLASVLLAALLADFIVSWKGKVLEFD